MPTGFIVNVEYVLWLLTFPPRGLSIWVLQEKLGDAQPVVLHVSMSVPPICATILSAGIISISKALTTKGKTHINPAAFSTFIFLFLLMFYCDMRSLCFISLLYGCVVVKLINLIRWFTYSKHPINIAIFVKDNTDSDDWQFSRIKWHQPNLNKYIGTTLLFLSGGSDSKIL